LPVCTHCQALTSRAQVELLHENGVGTEINKYAPQKLNLVAIENK